MDVLCTDKTGTLDHDRVILEIHCDVFKRRARKSCATPTSSAIPDRAEKLLDRAVLKYSELHRELSVEKFSKADEIPFDFRAA